MWSSWSLSRVVSKRFLVDSCASTMHPCFVFDFVGFFCHWYLQRFLCVLNGFLALSIFRIFAYCRPSIFQSPFMLFLFLNCFRHVGRNIRSQLMKSGGSLDRKYLLEVFNLIMWTSTFRSTSTFQWSSIRLSRNRSRFVCVILVTSMYFNGMFLFLACKVELQNRRGDDKWNLTLRTSESSFVSVGWDPSEFLWSSRSFPPLSGFSVSIISSTQLGCPIYDWEIWRKLFLGLITSFALILRASISDASKFTSSSMSATTISPFRTSHRDQHTSEAHSRFLSWSLDCPSQR